jgi:DNA-binding MarR family transcriptional regulator
VSSPLERIAAAIGDLMRVAESDRVHALRQRATGVELSRTEIRFLALVEDRGPLPVAEIGAVLQRSQPTASRTLRRLEEEGLVRRLVDRADGRVANFEVTPAGRKVRARFQAYMDLQMEHALASMAPERRELLADLLDELVAGSHREMAQPTGEADGSTARVASRRAKSSPATGREK